MDLMFAPLRKYADFEGRAQRAEYWLFVLLNVIVVCGVFAVALAGDLTMANYASSPVPVVLMIVLIGWTLVSFIPGLAVTVRRLHDSNHSGWWYFIGLVPLIGGVWLFILTLLDGSPSANRFGRDPKGRGVSEASVFE